MPIETPPDIGFAVNLPPEKAIEFFRQKGFRVSFRWRDTWKQAHSKAFTVAGAVMLDVLESIRGEVDAALAEGKTFRQFQQDLEPQLKKLGWLGRTEIVDPATGEVRTIDVNPWRLRNIYRTNMQTSYMAGRYREQWSRRETRPFWMYVAILDAAVRPSHEALNGSVFPADDPVWDWMYPPNDWGCRCRVRTLSQRRLDALGLKVRNGSGVKKFSGEGWDVNAGKEAFAPDLDTYPFRTAKAYTEGVMTGPAFQDKFRWLKNEVDRGTDFQDLGIDGFTPAGILSSENRSLIGAETQVVRLSDETLFKNIENHFPEGIGLQQYGSLPDVLDAAELIIREGGNNLLFQRLADMVVLAVVKATRTGKAMFLTSFRRSSLDEANRLRNKGEVIRDRL